MDIKSIKYSESGKTATLELIGGDTLTVEAEVLEECLGISESLEGDDVYSALTFSDSYLKALKKALGTLSYADNSRLALRRKLINAGYSREITDKVIERVCELGYIDEDRQIERLVVANAERLFGPHKITARLMAKGYSISNIKQVMRALTEAGEIDFDKNLKSLIEIKLGNNASDDEKQKLMHKYGYKK